MSSRHNPILSTIPPASEVHSRLGAALREVAMLRAMLRLAKLADNFRRVESEERGCREVARAF